MPNVSSLTATHILAGSVASAVIAWLALRSRALTRSGAIAAAVVGACAVAAGWSVAALLLVFFGSSTLLGRVGGRARRERLAAFVEKPGARDAAQVWANGGMFAVCCAAMAMAPAPVLAAAALGALAAATADTWATEIGTASAQAPRSVRTWRTVVPGTSGGVTLVGTLGAIAGAVVIASGALILEVAPRIAMAIAAGGVIGAWVDSLAGAWLQAERWCASCAVGTELRTHSCGAPTRVARAHTWLDNDGVNVLATVSGAVVSAIVADATVR